MSVVVLTYHAVGETRSPLWTSTEVLEAQVSALLRAGRQAIRLRDVVEALAQGDPLPTAAFAVTFDDGYASVHDRALPRLAELGVPATVFLVTGRMGGTNRWPSQPASVEEAPLLSWSQAEVLVEAGWEIGNHSDTHPPLTELPPAAAEEEMLRAEERLHERLGRRSTLFAFPYGAANAGLRAMAARHFQGVVGTRLGTVDRASDRYDLDRLDACYLTASNAARLDAAGFRCLLAIRRGARRVRRLVRRDWDAFAVREGDAGS